MSAGSSLVLRGGAVHEGNRLRVRDLVIDGSVIADGARSATLGEPTVVDVSGCSVLPGFVDLQVNGAMGVDLTTEPERLDEVAAFLPQSGVTSFMPTVITGAVGDTRRALDVMATASIPPAAAKSLGVHLEGPFISPQRAGAHPLRHVRPPSLDEVVGWCAVHRPAMVTLAPELPEALAVIAELVRSNVIVCAGHTAAGPRELAVAASAGLSGVTHLFNAMGALSARHPGPAGAVLGGDAPTAALIVGLIADGMHVDPVMVRMAWRLLGPERTALVTDCMAALGLQRGDYMLGETSVSVGQHGARTNDGVLAGSVLAMDEAVRNLMAFTGCDLATATVAASSTPSRLARRADIGRLSIGCAADVVVLDDAGRVLITIVAGTVAFDPTGRCEAVRARGSSWKS
ncbi:MAG: N-acetylglucosamine-6-phosphate deacetylase [Ilumatobacteraceae bacterium]|nr:N-acetylglucosamine-6-phosphate deacetylase [Ilumatobacteraceae bacterium]